MNKLSICQWKQKPIRPLQSRLRFPLAANRAAWVVHLPHISVHTQMDLSHIFQLQLEQ